MSTKGSWQRQYDKDRFESEFERIFSKPNREGKSQDRAVAQAMNTVKRQKRK